jgi:NAD(P)-dependent dehydrogenase (short-subunit alcohol dehydrogenase family)
VNVLVVGASRGIGLEFVRQYLAAGATVTATARDERGLSALRREGAKAIELDVADAESASRLAWQIDGSAFDVVVICAGVLSGYVGAVHAPAQDEFDRVMRTNVLGPMRVASLIPDSLAPGARLAMLSSSMATIATRGSGDAWLYRASKAALNSVLKDTSIALASRAICVAMDPGWVKTDMGGPSAPLQAADSVAGMRRVLAGLTPKDNGRFLDHLGHECLW